MTRVEQTSLSKLSSTEALLISRCASSSSPSSSPSSSAHRRREAETDSDAATVSTAAFYSLCLQVERDESLLPWERCGNSHSDDGWEPQWHRRLVSPTHNLQVQVWCRCAVRLVPCALRTAQRNCRGDVHAKRRDLATRVSQSQPI